MTPSSANAFILLPYFSEKLIMRRTVATNDRQMKSPYSFFFREAFFLMALKESEYF